MICWGGPVAPRFPPGFLEMRINDGAAALLRPLTIGARALRKQGQRLGDITYVAYLWFPWKCEFLPPPRTHNISTPPTPHPVSHPFARLVRYECPHAAPYVQIFLK